MHNKASDSSGLVNALETLQRAAIHWGEERATNDQIQGLIDWAKKI